MFLSSLKRALLAAAASLFVTAPSLFAADQIVDNLSSGTNQNLMENYWYYYDDNGGTKADDRPIAGKGTKQSTIDVAYTMIPREAGGNKADTFKMRNYSFLVKDDGTNKYACMPFTYGAKWKASWCTSAACAACFVGMGTMFAPDGKFLDLTGATAITFKCRSHVNDLTVTFKIETMDITKDSSFAFWAAPVAVPKNVWTSFTVAIPADLTQPGWATTAQKKTTFDQAECTKIAWEVHGDNNTAVTQDTLDVDDIVIKDYTYISPSMWTAVVSGPRPTSGLFADFEKTLYKNSTPLGTYWYAYNDHNIKGNSTVSQGATQDTGSGLLTLNWTSGTGFSNGGYGAALQMTLGKTVKQVNGPGDTANVQGFVGIGFNVYDSAGATYFNANTGKLGTIGGTGAATSIYFEYLADGDFPYLTLEVSDMNDVPDKTNPTRKDTRGSGIVWYRNLPKTGPAKWSAVEIPFNKLVTHDTWKGYKAIPLDVTQLAKIQFKVQGAEGNAGTIQIDNIYFPGIDFGLKQPVLNAASGSTQKSVFRAAYQSGVVKVDGTSMNGLKNVKINLIDSKGIVVKSDRVAAGTTSMNIAANNLPAGLYVVQMNGTSAVGKETVQRTAVTILK
jgi:hypothetical protein